VGLQGSAMRKPSRTWVSAVVGPAVFLGFLVWIISPMDMSDAPVVAFGVVFLAVATFGYLRRGVAKMRVATAEVTVPGKPLRVGEEFGFSYRQGWKRSTDVSWIRCELVLRETVRYSSGTQTVTENHDRVVQGFATSGQRFEPGQTIYESRRFRIPENEMHTFTPSPDNRIEWYIVVCVEMSRWPDHRWEHEVTVLPELLR
jgi:hypothetical protein